MVSMRSMKQNLERMAMVAVKASEEVKRMFRKFKELMPKKIREEDIKERIKALINEERYYELFIELSKDDKYWHVRFEVLSEVSRMNREKLTEQERIDIDNMLIHDTLWGDVTKILKLIVKGADINAKDKYGNSPMYCALYRGHPWIFEFFEKLNNINSSFHGKDLIHE